ncbi:hypothetical protein [Methanosarcina mazei]|uniref:hypothetical protein n=1 Tax=Methanosarcina mazei TaxID=2209 RepID=UPI0019111563|nr:hypothetical protein [Methanosarcina mazei]
MVKIREIMDECYGLLSIAFGKTYIEKGTDKYGANLTDNDAADISNQWITSPYCQIEPSMAFQRDIPFMIFREKGVIAEGILEIGAVGTYMPEFDLNSSINTYFESPQWEQLFHQWWNEVFDYRMYKPFETDDIIKHIVSCSICEEKEISPKELYDAFLKTINVQNSYDRFVGIIGADEKFEARYKIKDHNLESDYNTICDNYF